MRDGTDLDDAEHTIEEKPDNEFLKWACDCGILFSTAAGARAHLKRH